MARRITERDFQRAVVELARLHGWRVHHTRPSLNRRGQWRTPIQGDAGFPDLVLARNGRIIFAELKRTGERPTQQQHMWLQTLALCNGVEVYVWNPDDWVRIVEILGKTSRNPRDDSEPP
jgi:hypothetical protein